jgi:uncharacterized surface protein with fasciclin (FAS1) repeats
VGRSPGRNLNQDSAEKETTTVRILGSAETSMITAKETNVTRTTTTAATDKRREILNRQIISPTYGLNNKADAEEIQYQVNNSSKLNIFSPKSS